MLGVRLVERNRQGIEPTPYGRALLKRGAAIFDELRQGLTEIEHLADPAAGEVRIAASAPMTGGILPIVIDRLSRRYPRIAVFVTETPIAILQHRIPTYRDLREREVDLMLGPVVNIGAEDDLAAEFLFDEALHAAASTQNQFVRRRRISLADLADEPWCLPPLDSVVGARCVEAFRLGGLAVPRRLVITVSLQTQLGLLAAGRHFTMFPSSLLRFSGKRFSIQPLPIELAVEPRRIGIVTLKDRSISPVAQLLIREIREVAAQLKPRSVRPATAKA
jgi:DNA-binding transcriptional LysR family regulator